MSVKIITGAIGAGKTRLCIDELRKTHNEHPDTRCIMLVPSHYSHETERMLIKEFGGTGLNNIECTSFEKLARELCRAISMTLSQIQNDNEQLDRRIVRAVSKGGFVDVAASLISEMHRYNVTYDTLNEYAKSEKNPVLAQKLKVLSYISEKYDKLLTSADYVDADDDLSRLASVICNHFKNCDKIWIDKFDEFLPQQFEVVRALIDSGADITITFAVHKNTDDT